MPILVLFLGLFLALTGPVSAQAYDARELQKLYAPDGARSDYFGQWISIDGGTAVIGASGDDDRDTDSGSAYVFTRDGFQAWTQTQKLLAADGTRGDGFGVSVSLGSDTLVVGADRADPHGPNSGSAYVFRRDPAGWWIQEDKLTPADAAPYTYFGSSVAVHGDVILVGAASGAVYVFARDESGRFIQRQELVPSDGVPLDEFGYALALRGNAAIIGAPRSTLSNPGPGAAYVFARDEGGTWTERAKLVDRDGRIGDRFGSSVAIDGDTALVGAYGPDAEGRWYGAAHVFSRSGGTGWTQEATLLPSDGNLDTAFGWSVALARRTALVGAREAADNGVYSGAVYVFAKSSAGVWSERAKLLASDGSEFEYFGTAVAAEPGTALVGALTADGAGPATGAAYHYALPLQIALDVEPEDELNRVNVRSRGVLPVAVLGAPDFDVTRLDVDSLRLGPRGATPAHDLDDAFVYADHLQDVNSDGYLDLILHFSVWGSGIECGGTAAILTGATIDGAALEGADGLSVLGCRLAAERSSHERDVPWPRDSRAVVEIQH